MNISCSWRSTWTWFLTCAAVFFLVRVVAAKEPVPNVLWITCEDMGPHLGCYGDAYSTTPNLDRFAKESLRYTRAWSCAPVCAPARTTLISGLYPPSTGSEHMRSMTRLPAGMLMYPQHLRAAGYYCTNNSKEDYNLEQPGRVWDESSGKAHWRKRGTDQPFFAVFNILTTHESQIRSRPHKLVHDPKMAPLPPYHPDTPEVRHDWAQYYDNITTMDGEFAARLKELEEAGLADSTVVIFCSDHGSGMPRNKRSAQNSGLQVPLLVRIPPKFKHLAPPDYAAGGVTGRLCSFIDFAPTLLSLCGVKPPATMPGRAFLGNHLGPPPEYLFGFRGRMDERYDLVRCVRNDRHVYVRNFMPHLPHGQHNAYMFITPTTATWKKLLDAGQLNEVQSAFWRPKAPEELYDLETDRFETNNLALAPTAEQKIVLEKLRGALHEHQLATADVDLLPEAEMLSRSASSSPYELGHSASQLPLARVLATAEAASSLNASGTATLRKALSDDESGVRYWAALGLLMRGPEAVRGSQEELKKLLADASPSVRIAAAEALAQHGNEEAVSAALAVLLKLAAADTNDYYVAVAALNALDHLPPALVKPQAAVLRACLPHTKKIEKRYDDYVPRLVAHLVGEEE